MNNFRKCGAMYIEFDKQNNPEYGFVVDDYDNVISKFYPLCDRQLEKISLPYLPTAYGTLNTEMQQNLMAQQTFKQNCDKSFAAVLCDDNLIRYAKGGAKIAPGCFAGIKKLQIVAPVNYSIMLDWDCFDQNAQIELQLPSNMGLKQVGRVFDTGYDYSSENWTLIAHKKFDFTSANGRDSYDTRDFDPKNSRCQITVNHIGVPKLKNCTIGDNQITKASGPETKSLPRA